MSDISESVHLCGSLLLFITAFVVSSLLSDSLLYNSLLFYVLLFPVCIFFGCVIYPIFSDVSHGKRAAHGLSLSSDTSVWWKYLNAPSFPAQI